MAEEAKILPLEFALGALSEQLPAAEDLEHLHDVEQVLLHRGRVDQAVVHIHERAPAQRARRTGDPTVDWHEVLSGPPARRCCRSGGDSSCSSQSLVAGEVETDSQRLVHDAHQQRGGPLQTERHHAPLELAQLRTEASLPPVRCPQSQLEITTREIELGEEVRPTRAVEQRLNVWRLLDSRACDGVEAR